MCPSLAPLFDGFFIPCLLSNPPGRHCVFSCSPFDLVSPCLFPCGSVAATCDGQVCASIGSMMALLALDLLEVLRAFSMFSTEKIY